MIFVVDNIYVASSCPKRLEPLAAEIRKSIHHAFVEKEEMERFFDTVQQNLQQEVPGKSMKISVFHTRYEEGGTLCIRRADADNGDFIRLHYFRLQGHIHVSKDGTSLHQEEFIEEGGAHDV